MSFVNTFGNSNLMRILDYFVHSASDVDVMNICRELNLSRKTVDKFMKILVQSGLIYASRKIGKSVMYKKNPKLMAFSDLAQDAAILKSAEQMQGEAK